MASYRSIPSFPFFIPAEGETETQDPDAAIDPKNARLNLLRGNGTEAPGGRTVPTLIQPKHALRSGVDGAKDDGKVPMTSMVLETPE